MIPAFSRVMIYRIDGTGIWQKTYNFPETCLRRQLRKLIREQNAFLMIYAPSISELESMEFNMINIYELFRELNNRFK